MKKICDLVVRENKSLNNNYCLLKVTPIDGSILPPMQPGQFAQIKIDGSPKTFLRRPISINFVDTSKNELWLLVQIIGEGTKTLSRLKVNDTLNIVLPLGNTFELPQSKNDNILLVGGGVGIAPMLFLGCNLAKDGYSVNFLLGARSKEDLLELDEFSKYGNVYTTTEDGSYGETGYVTNHSILENINFKNIYTCGPKPMMVAIARYANIHHVTCQVSLENMMACGFGACLCCVEKTIKGNVCACTEGPIFNINELTWID